MVPADGSAYHRVHLHFRISVRRPERTESGTDHVAHRIDGLCRNRAARGYCLAWMRRPTHHM